jgi:hypothetical protein
MFAAYLNVDLTKLNDAASGDGGPLARALLNVPCVIDSGVAMVRRRGGGYLRCPAPGAVAGAQVRSVGDAEKATALALSEFLRLRAYSVSVRNETTGTITHKSKPELLDAVKQLTARERVALCPEPEIHLALPGMLHELRVRAGGKASFGYFDDPRVKPPPRSRAVEQAPLGLLSSQNSVQGSQFAFAEPAAVTNSSGGAAGGAGSQRFELQVAGDSSGTGTGSSAGSGGPAGSAGSSSGSMPVPAYDWYGYDTPEGQRQVHALTPRVGKSVILDLIVHRGAHAPRDSRRCFRLTTLSRSWMTYLPLPWLYPACGLRPGRKGAIGSP